MKKGVLAFFMFLVLCGGIVAGAYVYFEKSQENTSGMPASEYIASRNSKSNNSSSKSYTYSTSSKSKTYDDLKKETQSWMKKQASGKNYTKNDGGTYYCMGKHDTCKNKTHNAYDLYCDSCDPNGDNIEG